MRLGSLRSGGLIATYRCTAACGHCIQNSSPTREATYIGRMEAREVLETVRGLGCRSLHIGGGEPFLDLDGLCGLIQEMDAAGVDVDYIETNGFWAADPGEAMAAARRLRDYGPLTVMLSLCPYHAPYVPLRSVRNALDACERAGLSTFVWQEQFAREVRALGDEGKTHSLKEYQAMFPGALDALPERFGARLLGRAAVTHQELRSTQTEALLAQAAPCPGPLRTGHFHVDCFGDLIPPGCPGLAIRLSDARDIDEGSYPTVCTLVGEGAGALYEKALTRGFAPRGRYESLCALCQHVRTHLALRDSEAWPDLRPRGFYRELPLA